MSGIEKKLAIFVEGYTEVLFVDRLITEIAGNHNVRIELRTIRGGRTIPRAMGVLRAANADTGQRFYVLIVDCGGDHLVASRILEEHKNLTLSGYQKIIGLRDVRPTFSFAEIPKLEAGLKKLIDLSLIPVEFVLAVMEIEAWFLSEHTHFERFDPSISLPQVNAALGVDVSIDDLSLRDHPADDLDKSYQIAGKRYEKAAALNTIQCLDIPYMYVDLQNRVPSLKRLTSSIDAFLT